MRQISISRWLVIESLKGKTPTIRAPRDLKLTRNPPEKIKGWCLGVGPDFFFLEMGPFKERDSWVNCQGGLVGKTHLNFTFRTRFVHEWLWNYPFLGDQTMQMYGKFGWISL